MVLALATFLATAIFGLAGRDTSCNQRYVKKA
jgi:hypothetical protein